MIHQHITEFGRRMGMPSLQLANNGIVALDVDRIGRISLERKAPTGTQDRPPYLLIYLTVPSPAHDTALHAKVLDLCHYRHDLLLPLVGGIHKENLMLLTRLSEREVNAAQIETAIHFLVTQMNKLNS